MRDDARLIEADTALTTTAVLAKCVTRCGLKERERERERERPNGSFSPFGRDIDPLARSRDREAIVKR